jgi:hypothetical protein
MGGMGAMGRMRHDATPADKEAEDRMNRIDRIREQPRRPPGNLVHPVHPGQKMWNYLELSWKSTIYMSSSNFHHGWRNLNTKDAKITKLGMKARLEVASQRLPQAAHNFFYLL